MNRLTLFTKPGCHLCDIMKAVITGISDEIDFKYEEINIESDKLLFEKYGKKIPVLSLNGRMIAKYSIDKDRLLKMLKDKE